MSDTAERWLAAQPAADVEGYGYLRAFGRFYGYPACCVEAFVADRERAPRSD